MQQLNLNSTGRGEAHSNHSSVAGGYSNNRAKPPKIEYDVNELESKSPEELDRIL